MDIKIDACPFCNGTEFIRAYQSGHATLQSRESFWHSADLEFIICRRCGSVVRSYVKNPEKLLKKADRKES